MARITNIILLHRWLFTISTDIINWFFLVFLLISCRSLLFLFVSYIPRSRFFFYFSRLILFLSFIVNIFWFVLEHSNLTANSDSGAWKLAAGGDGGGGACHGRRRQRRMTRRARDSLRYSSSIHSVILFKITIGD